MKNYRHPAIGTLPEEWEVRSLEELAEKISDGIHTTPNYIDNSDYYFINGNNLINGTIRIGSNPKLVSEAEYIKYKKNLNERTVLLSINGTIGNLALYKGEKVVLGKSAAYIICSKSLNVNYLYHLLKSEYVLAYFYRELTGTTIKNLSLKTIKATLVALPPLPEQQKIAEILSTVDEKMAVIDEQLAQTQELKKGLMQRLLTRGIGHTTFKDSPLGEIPEKWQVRSIGSFVTHYKRGASLKPSDFVISNGFEVIPKKAIGRGGRLILDRRNKTLCSFQFADVSKESIVNSSYIITTLRDLVPSGPSIGYMVEYDGQEEYLIAQGVYAFKVNDELDKRFIIQFSNTDIFRKVMQKIKVGSTQVHIRTQDYFDVIVPVPPIAEQQKIALLLDTLDDKNNVLTKKKAQYQELKRGLMQQLLTGQRRVKVQELATL